MFHSEAAAQLNRQGWQHFAELLVLLWERASMDTLARLHHHLVQLAKEDQNHMVWDTQHQLARWLWMHREDVNKALRHLEAQGLIQRGSHRRGIRLLEMQVFEPCM